MTRRTVVTSKNLIFKCGIRYYHIDQIIPNARLLMHLKFASLLHSTTSSSGQHLLSWRTRLPSQSVLVVSNGLNWVLVQVAPSEQENGYALGQRVPACRGERATKSPSTYNAMIEVSCLPLAGFEVQLNAGKALQSIESVGQHSL